MTQDESFQPETGCFMYYKLHDFKLLTFLFLSIEAFSYQSLFAQTIDQELAKTHLRWNLYTEKQNVNIEKKGKILFLKTLDVELYKNIKQELRKIPSQKRYILDVIYKGLQKNTNVNEIQVKLVSTFVDVFNFYRERDKKHVIDFWLEEDDENVLKPVLKKVIKKKKVNKKVGKTSNTKSKVNTQENKKPNLSKTSLKIAKPKKVKNPGYRDFRYGASFIFDYSPLSPKIKKNFDLRTKTPELFYPIKNRNYNESEKEAHLQLAINLYRKKKYGLMYKSIKLFQEKYGADSEIDILEYLKANAILRDNIAGGNLEPVKMAINMLSSIGSRTTNYELKSSIYKYLLTYLNEKKEYVEALTIAKRFYVASKENFDYESSSLAAENILYTLAELNQVGKVAEVVRDPTITKILSKSKLIAYEIYVNHKLGDMDSVIKIYKQNKRGLVNPIEDSILFNTAEAYFRKAKYKQSIEIFDKFITHYSYHNYSSKARLRVALMYELMEKDINQTIVLYKNAINRSQNRDVSTEARIRFAALRSIRKLNLNEKDLEFRAFMDFDENTKLTKNHKKLLWLSRLRGFIVDKEYLKALTYLSALPLTSLKKIEKRVFEADGAEIIYGLISTFYEKSDYSKVVELWGTYRDRYIRKVANDPYMNFIVGKSYLKLGLYDNFESLYSSFKELERAPQMSFPLWIPRKKNNNKEVLLELSILKDIKLKNWKKASAGIQALLNINNSNEKVYYYKGLVNFNNAKYDNSVSNFESFLSGQKGRVFYDSMELAEMFNAYSESLYNLGRFEKFQEVVSAILNDTKTIKSKSLFIKSMRERLSYLSVEVMGKGINKKNALLLESKIKQLLKEFPKTNYKYRINYLLGISLVKNKKMKEARKLYEEMLGDQEVPGSIKELVKSELSLMTIKERTI